MPFKSRFSSHHLYDNTGKLKSCVKTVPNKSDKFLLDVSSISLYIKHLDDIEITVFNKQVTVIGNMKTVAAAQLILDIQDHECINEII